MSLSIHFLTKYTYTLISHNIYLVMVNLLIITIYMLGVITAIFSGLTKHIIVD